MVSPIGSTLTFPQILALSASRTALDFLLLSANVSKRFQVRPGCWSVRPLLRPLGLRKRPTLDKQTHLAFLSEPTSGQRTGHI